MICGKIERKGSAHLKGSGNIFNQGDTVTVLKTGECVTISKFQYVKHMKKYCYKVSEHPSTFFFEEEFENGKKKR
ncbi:hypothetical protein ABE41_015265 [Fictibacillus arsenicus]|jgi:hypothetical protein|uniref:Uncharacterized protein n=1 Tax=Fictibacillus arsenicus TaxID=255247 RepID=A0A1B1Z7C0_9BACL|nr:hypothetical protein ABE41_015265 [Fictibacillus arsenicus]